MATAAPITDGCPGYSVSDLGPLDNAHAVLVSAQGAAGILAEVLTANRAGSDEVNAAYAIAHLLEALTDNLERFHTAIFEGRA